jgi:CRP-like cAMP-binding protein
MDTTAEGAKPIYTCKLLHSEKYRDLVYLINEGSMERITFEAGETIMNFGEESDTAFLIITGRVIAHLPNGLKKQLGPGEMFGEMGLIDRQPRSATVVAADYTVCATYTEEQLLGLIRSDPDEAIFFIRALIARLRAANEGR